MLLVTRTALIGPFGIQNFANDFFAVNPIPNGTYGFGRITFSQDELWVVLVAWGLVALAMVLVSQLVTSPWGRVLRAIREDEDAVRSLGKSPFLYKLQSLILGGVMAALAGMMLAFDQQSVSPGYYLPALTFFVFTVVILGGPGTVYGPIVGAAIFWFILQFTGSFLSHAISSGWIPASVLTSDEVAQVRFMLVGASLMALAIWRPQGIFGKREEVMIDVR